MAQPSANWANLRRLFWLRNIAILGQLGAVWVAHVHLHMALPLLPLLGIITGLGIFNVLVLVRLRRGSEAGHHEFLAHLSIDVVALTGLIYLTGGASNPFVLLFLLPVTIAAMILPGRYTWALALLTIACYSLLMWQHQPFPHAHSDMSEFGLHVVGMWLAFVLSAGLIAYFVVGMGNTLRAQEQALLAAREKSLRDEQMVALGTLAASTAHELGSPLGSVALLAQELEEELSETSPAMKAQLNTLRTQVDRCKDALATLSGSAGGVRLTGGRAMPANEFVEQLLDEWRTTRSNANLKTQWSGSRPAPPILADQTLGQALTNILHNAADASPEYIECDVSWSQDALLMEVRDRGPGLTAKASQMVGKHPYSTKSEGLGLGLYLSHAVIDRLGGHVSLFNRDGGGVCTRVQLPLDSLARKPAP